MSFEKNKKKIFSMTISVLISAGTALSASAVISYADDDSGKCGNDAEWSYSDGTLTISGSGSMYDYEDNSQPWAGYNGSITSINVSGVTYIGAYTFCDMSSLSYAYISGTVESIGDNAFSSSQTVTLEVEKGSYAQIYADYTGFDYKLSSSSETEYEKLTDPENAGYATGVGGVDNTEINTASEVETDKSGNIVIVPYAGAASADILPDGGVAANGVIVVENTETTESTTETAATAVPQQTETFVNSEEAVSRISWKLEDGVLTILGSGDIDTYEDITQIPWFSKRKEISELVISDNITGISAYAFAQCTNLEKVTLPSTLYNIADHAFYNCKKLKEISVPSSVLDIGEEAIGFVYDGKLKKAVTESDFVIYGEMNSAAEEYAQTNGIKFVQKIQKNDVVIPDEKQSTGLSFRFKLVAVTAAAVVIAFTFGIIFYIWQRKGGLEKLREKEKIKK